MERGQLKGRVAGQTKGILSLVWIFFQTKNNTCSFKKMWRIKQEKKKIIVFHHLNANTVNTFKMYVQTYSTKTMSRLTYHTTA